MRIHCYLTHQSLNVHNLKEKTVIVLDILRATTSMVTALNNGAQEIIAVKEIEDALRLKQAMPDAILSGERNGIIIDGFQLGNSPYDFPPETVDGKTIIACTTNGTSAVSAARKAKAVWIGSLINSRAVAIKAVKEVDKELVILCSGTGGEPSLDDLLGAGAIIHYIMATIPKPWLNDSARIAVNMYDYYAGQIYKGLLHSKHGEKLYRLGRKDDIAYCSQESIIDIVPVLKDNKIIKP